MELFESLSEKTLRVFSRKLKDFLTFSRLPRVMDHVAMYISFSMVL